MAGKQQNPWRDDEAMVLARAIACGTFCPCCIVTLVPVPTVNDRQGDS
jgi:hypothetical protein